MEIEVKITKDGDTKILKFVPEPPPVLPYVNKPYSSFPSIRIDYETEDVIDDFGFVKQEPTGRARVKIFGRLLKGE